MASFNRVILVGNLTRDPEVSWTPGTNGPSVAVARLGLAVSEKYKNRAGELAETVCFVDVVAWRAQAENCGKYLSKGSPVLVEGRLQLDTWKTKEGESRSKLRVRADRVQFLGGSRTGQGGGEPALRERTAQEPAAQSQLAAQESSADWSVGHAADEGESAAVDEENLPF